MVQGLTRRRLLTRAVRMIRGLAAGVAGGEGAVGAVEREVAVDLEVHPRPRGRPHGHREEPREFGGDGRLFAHRLVQPTMTERWG